MTLLSPWILESLSWNLSQGREEVVPGDIQCYYLGGPFC